MVAASGDVETLDRLVRFHVHRTFAELGHPPTPIELSRVVDADPTAVEDSLRRLADAHVIVLAPGTPYVWMAAPFSAIPTEFVVSTRDRRYWGNCIWDALGIAACLHADHASIETACPDCGEPLALAIEDGTLVVPSDGVIQFALPAARWWEDIGAT